MPPAQAALDSRETPDPSETVPFPRTRFIAGSRASGRSSGRVPRAVASALGIALLPSLVACGASVSRKYESDVRFERCLALDWKQDADETVQRRCWSEWASYYAEGQSRDRIEHARAMLAKLERGGSRAADATKLATPDPTSAFAPPPMMFAQGDGGTAADADASGARVELPELSPCEAKCEASIAGCLSRCRGDACERACTSRFLPCLKRCER